MLESFESTTTQSSRSSQAESPPIDPQKPTVDENRSTKPKRKRGRRKWWILGILVLIIGAIVLGAIQAGREKPVNVQTALIERVPILKAEVSASGTIEAKNSVDIQAEIAGNIIELPVVEGQWVEKGEILVQIDPTQTLADLKATEAQLSASRADSRAQEVQVAQARANMARDIAFRTASEAEREQAQLRDELSQKRLVRAKDLHEGGVNSIDELDAAISDSRLAKAAIRLADARVAQYEAQILVTELTIRQAEEALEGTQQRAEVAAANLERWKDVLSKTTIRSPLKGLITQLNVDQGERAVPGVLSNPQATLMTIADMSALEGWIEVDESDIVKVTKGNKVTVEVDALPNRKMIAMVTEVGYAPVIKATGTQEGKDFLVKAALVDLEDSLVDSLRPGMSCDATIVTAVKENVLVMPIQAWTPREVAVDENGLYLADATVWPKKKKKSSSKDKESAQRRTQGPRKELDGVFIIKGDRARFQPIQTGITGEMDIQVLGGLDEGDEIIVGPYKIIRELSDDDWIKIDNSESFYFNREGQGK